MRSTEHNILHWMYVEPFFGVVAVYKLLRAGKEAVLLPRDIATVSRSGHFKQNTQNAEYFANDRRKVLAENISVFDS